MTKVTTLNHTSARAFLLKEKSYTTIKLPSYFTFQLLLNSVSDELANRPIGELYNEKRPARFANVNYNLLMSEDGKYEWYPLSLIHPALYVALVNKITEEAHWNTLVDQLNKHQYLSEVISYSIPMDAEVETLSEKTFLIPIAQANFEQKSEELAQEYKYVLQAEIVDCYGHHGTSEESANAIIQKNFCISKGDSEWLGDGVYFFVEGVSSKTADLAEKWVIAQAWNPKERKNNYATIGIIESLIEVKESDFLDLTIEDGVEIFNYLIERYESKLQSIDKKLKYADGYLINLVRKEKVLPLEVVKGNFYIKFKRERISYINMRTSNCTICAVYEPSKTIKESSIIKIETIT